jgi:hypothetical protein
LSAPYGARTAAPPGPEPEPEPDGCCRFLAYLRGNLDDDGSSDREREARLGLIGIMDVAIAQTEKQRRWLLAFRHQLRGFESDAVRKNERA